MLEDTTRIAAIVPCHNEEITVEKVVSDLKAAVPGITVYVYDNCSSDRTSERAAAAGAIVRKENTPGKGNVVRRAFADIEADIYVMIDGDDTYEAAHLPEMIDTLVSGPYDHVLGVRQDNQETTSYRPGHEAGNRMFNQLTGWLFRSQVSDMLSGYRVFSRRFVKSFPAISRRFEIETELTVHTMFLRLPTAEVPIDFRDRPDGSESKLSTFEDGFRILGLISALVRHERPRLFYGSLTLIFAALSMVFGIPVIWEFWQTGLVPRFPTAILAAALMGLAFLLGSVGLTLDGLRRARRETSRLSYLGLPAVDVRSVGARVADEMDSRPNEMTRNASSGAEGMPRSKPQRPRGARTPIAS
ncbi:MULTISPECIES: glycosyltransferase [unclassified Brevibacterium]|uniref:glycosyltransferase n=1 Tax=unclassified Brevibacterium TaxID=2614124 RepID=UPI001E2FBBAD|nr:MULTISPECIES: glycosyltransferase [unclassified Brevibacterium]MCD1285570.1 glycosyl transferase [Brevibacterium sp. CCUG 69071]MDK8434624.1 glycosyltransferase [Brevibacterium sp. H-BE7]